MTESLLCPACGVMKKSGKTSCCGLGGSWFEDCGSVGDAKLDHTWNEGIRSCKARKSVDQKMLSHYNKTFDDESMGIIKSESVFVTSTSFPCVLETTLNATSDRNFTCKTISTSTLRTFANMRISNRQSTMPCPPNGTMTSLLGIDMTVGSMWTSPQTSGSESITSACDSMFLHDVTSNALIFILIVSWFQEMSPRYLQ